MINVIYEDKNRIKISKSEVCRYMGYKAADIINPLDKLITDNIQRVAQALKCKACYDIFPVQAESDGNLNLTFMSAKSKNLAKALCKCSEFILFTATIGIEIDRIIAKASRLSPTDALIFQAAGAAAIEDWCDIICENFRLDFEKRGKYLTPRFSPGYGDFPLSAQKEIFRALECPKKIGVSLTDSLMMVPSKSVSAIIGITDEKPDFSENKCKSCNNKECEFRKE